MSARAVTHLNDESGSFREDAPRPPVPGEEGQKLCQLHTKSQRSKSVSLPINPRRNDDGLGEPEGSASPDLHLVRWAKSLHSLLGDQDGAHLFRTFLEREKCVDTLDFWFACNGFRQMDLMDTKTLRVAKAIHKRYIENYSVVARQLKLATKVFIRDCMKRQQIDSTMFDQAQAEIQILMEDNAYQMFLTSDIYIEYVRTGGENAAHVNSMALGSLKLVTGYLPTLNEEEELNCVELKAKGSPSVVGLSSKALRATASSRARESIDSCYRSYQRSEPINPYHVSSGYVFAPTTSANESEISSDAMTDDSMSMTDSSVDGIPPYRSSNKKQHQREMNRSIKANGQVPLPHFPRTHRLPREMTPVEPAVFAAELIARLEKVKQEQETMQTLEERLQQIKEEEEREECETPIFFQAPRDLLVSSHQPPTSCDDDPQTILDEHLSRVLKTPSCQSPPCVGRSCSPGRTRVLRPTGAVQSVPCPVLTKSFVTKQTTKHVHHYHYIHHHAVPRTKEEIEAEAARRVQCLCTSPADYCCFLQTRTHCRDLPLLHMDAAGSRSRTLSRRKVTSDHLGEGRVDTTTVLYQLPMEEHLPTAWQRAVECENERPSKHRSHSAHNIKRNTTCETTRASSAERLAPHHQWGAPSGHTRSQQPLHPPVQETTVVSVNTLAQLEEACRRLAEVSRPKQRCPSSSHQRSHSVPCPSAIAAQVQKDPKRQPSTLGPELTLTYFFCGEEIPYRRMLKMPSLTLGLFKDQLSKKGNYRYYFKKASREFDCGAVFEEICDDDAILPLYEGRVLGKVERID
ncbi:axin-2 isoform X1 [Bufo gargarizans]|uniref:axin-2 isoform X1 n=1 Tax=Bufo gargarizans TaxID=30331 RepID=UPI001CF4FAE6|nr:axin-2 isoform X1 [Bufo gargarizans]XP_044129672.1 axin-2 isoform X1 [Bufo gargarizans]XP_044129673.1 axin-2 isoform X1 [Bufo gargarizans]